jgi:NAD(P)-dependent dehydrogenase (short-subunit alcohol dehydrogenase family)
MKKNKVIVTGSEGFLGKSIASHLDRSHDVIKLSRRLGHDLTDEVFVKEWFAKNKADYLVNCFGMNDAVTEGAKRDSLFEVSLPSVEEFLRVNVVSLFSVCREFARNKQAKGIVNISSIYGVVSPVPGLYKKGEKHIGYSVSKAAVIQLTRHMAVHLAPRVRMNCIVPGGAKDSQGREFIEDYGKRVPLGRMMAKGELDGIVEYLCSDKSSYMTGAVIVVDGGWTAL